MAGTLPAAGPRPLTGQSIIGELIRNMELGRFELQYSVLLPCIFTVYLNPADYAHLSGVLTHIAADARRALAEQVAGMNRPPRKLGLRRSKTKEHKIAARDWVIDFVADSEGVVPPGDVEIHSELNEAPQPGFQGMKTTLIEREPSVTSRRSPPAAHSDTQPVADRVYAEIRYEDESGPQVYRMTQNTVRVGRGGDQEPMDLALYTNDEVSREHLVLRRDAATGRFYVEDRSSNGTWLDGRRLKTGAEHALPERAEIGVAQVITLNFQVRR